MLSPDFAPDNRVVWEELNMPNFALYSLGTRLHLKDRISDKRCDCRKLVTIALDG